MRLKIGRDLFKRYGFLIIILLLMEPILSNLEMWLNGQGIYYYPPISRIFDGLYILAPWCLVFIVFKGFVANCGLEDRIKAMATKILTLLFCVLVFVISAASIYLAYLDMPNEKTYEGYYIVYEEIDGIGDVVIDGVDMRVYIAKPHSPFTMLKVERNKEFTYNYFETMKEEAYRAIFDKYYAETKYRYEVDFNAKGYSRLKLYEDEFSVEFLMYDESFNEEPLIRFIHYSYPKDDSGSVDWLTAEDVASYIYDTENKTAKVM